MDRKDTGHGIRGRAPPRAVSSINQKSLLDELLSPAASLSVVDAQLFSDSISVLRHRVTRTDGVCVVVAASWDPTTYRLGLEHIRPAGDESK